MKYTEVQSSRSGTTAIYQGDDGSLVNVYEMKSGRVEYCPVSALNPSLTVRVRPESARTFECDKITQVVTVPAER
uniref:Uncharacterized protein n=1 Tax=viral metagenome TaxID=1070528 RepID=A0A6M3LMU6_9ZZZZ